VQSLPAPVEVDAITLNNDLAPTLTALAGVELGSADGRSLLALLGTTPPMNWRKRLLIEHWIDQAGSTLDMPDFAAVRTGADGTFPERLYVEYYADAADASSVIATELYDLTEPLGKFQLHSRHADRTRAGERIYLKRLLEALKRCGMVDGIACRQTED
jgi:arylsulfatase A-like enzyme